MAQNPDLTVRIVGANADASVSVVGGQVIEATGADIGKIVTVGADGSLGLEDLSAALAAWATDAELLQALADLPQLGTGLEVIAGFMNVNAIDVQIFTASGTFTKVDGARQVLVLAQAGGGGGASGYRDVEGTLRYGGGGGAAGGLVRRWVDADDLDATEAVTVGAGGAGGAALTSTTGVGEAGSAGGDSVLDTISGEVRAVGGLGASHVFGINPGVGAGLKTGDLSRGGSCIPAGTSLPDQMLFNGYLGGGGAGQARTAANANAGSGSGGASEGAPGGASGNPGAAGTAGAGGTQGAGGGGGGVVGNTGAAAGGAGGVPGGGGGGGSFGNSSLPGNSGAGGAGARGEVWVITFQ